MTHYNDKFLCDYTGPLFSSVTKVEETARKGDKSAQFELGWRLYVGDGVPRDRQKAVYWYKEAARQGLSHAEELLARIDQEEIDDIAGQNENGSSIRSRRLTWQFVLAILIAGLFLAAGYLARPLVDRMITDSTGAMGPKKLTGDLDGDSDVDFTDLALLMDSWLTYQDE